MVCWVRSSCTDPLYRRAEIQRCLYRHSGPGGCSQLLLKYYGIGEVGLSRMWCLYRLLLGIKLALSKRIASVDRILITNI
jgi:hypothetical protein